MQMLELSLSLDAFRPHLEAAAEESGLVLDFLMRNWNGRFATYNVGIPTEENVDPRRNVRDEERRYRLLGRVKANTRGERLLVSLNPPTACDLVPTPEEEAHWQRFARTLQNAVADGR